MDLSCFVVHCVKGENLILCTNSDCNGCIASDLEGASNWDFLPDWMNLDQATSLFMVLFPESC